MSEETAYEVFIREHGRGKTNRAVAKTVYYHIEYLNWTLSALSSRRNVAFVPGCEIMKMIELDDDIRVVRSALWRHHIQRKLPLDEITLEKWFLAVLPRRKKSFFTFIVTPDKHRVLIVYSEGENTLTVLDPCGVMDVANPDTRTFVYLRHFYPIVKAIIAKFKLERNPPMYNPLESDKSAFHCASLFTTMAKMCIEKGLDIMAPVPAKSQVSISSSMAFEIGSADFFSFVTANISRL